MHLGWNGELKKYGILNNADLWVLQGLHDGDKLHVKIDGAWVDTIIRFDGDEWYLTSTELRGNQLEGLEVNIRYKFL